MRARIRRRRHYILPPAVLSRVVVVFHVIISKHGRLAPDQYNIVVIA